MPNIIQQLRDTYSENPAKALEMLPELFQQYDEGLIPVLPCKVGDPIYYFWTDDDKPEIEMEHIFEFCVDEEGLYISTDPYDGFLCYVSELGKKSNAGRIVILSREDTEKALEEQKNEYSNNDY